MTRTMNCADDDKKKNTTNKKEEEQTPTVLLATPDPTDPFKSKPKKTKNVYLLSY